MEKKKKKNVANRDCVNYFTLQFLTQHVSRAKALMKMSTHLNINGWQGIDKIAKQYGVGGTMQVQRALAAIVCPVGVHPALMRFNRNDRCLEDDELDKRKETNQTFFE